MDQRVEIEQNPYPGLRSFGKNETHIFFGRDNQIDSMIDRLAATQFLCVTGPSGCGKSSLARTGLMSSLEAGFLPQTGSDWIFCDLNPGRTPLENLFGTLARQVARTQLMDPEAEPEKHVVQRLYRYFSNYVRRISGDLSSALADLDISVDQPVLILVDQFEELFRYAQKTPGAARTFVDILLKSAATRRQIYVTITIRTDQLEKCSRYPGLTRAINEGQYLTPVLDRFQVQDAIEGPAALYGHSIDRKFLVWLLNGLEEELDKLPLMQHLLKILYDQKRAQSDTQTFTIDFEDFNTAFKSTSSDGSDELGAPEAIRRSLSDRLDEAYGGLDDTVGQAPKKLFCALTTLENRTRDIRRTPQLNELADTIGLDVQKTREIIDQFNANGETYLRVRDVPDDPEGSVVDVTHECVLRVWKRLQDPWLIEEQRAADNIKLLADTAEKHEKRVAERGLLRKWIGSNSLPDYLLDLYSKWFSEFYPNATWAARYLQATESPDSPGSPDAQQKQAQDIVFKKIRQLLIDGKRYKRSRIFAVILSSVAVVISGLYVVIQEQEQKREEAIQKELARSNEELSLALQLSQIDIAAGHPVRDIETVTGVAINADVAPDSQQTDSKRKIQDEAFSELRRALLRTHELYRYRPGAGPNFQVRAADFAPDGKTLLTLNTKGPVLQWQLGKTDAPVREFREIIPKTESDVPIEGRSLKVSPTADVAVIGFRGGSVMLLNLVSKASTELLFDGQKPHKASVLDLEFSDNGSILVSASHDGVLVVWKHVRGGQDGGTDPIHLWTLEDLLQWNLAYDDTEAWRSQDIERKRTVAKQIWSVDIDPSGTLFAFGTGNGRVCVGNVANLIDLYCSKEGHPSGESVKAIEFHPNGNMLVSAGNDDSASVWAITRDAHDRPVIEHTGVALYLDSDTWDLGFSPSGTLLAVGSWDGNTTIYEVGTWRIIARLLGHTDALRSVRFSSSGQYILTASIDQTARVWTVFANRTNDDALTYAFPNVGRTTKQQELKTVTLGPKAEWIAFADASRVWVKQPQQQSPSQLDLPSGVPTNASFGDVVAHPTEPLLFASMRHPQIAYWKKTNTDDWIGESFDLPGGVVLGGRGRAVDVNRAGTELAVVVREGGSSYVLLCSLESGLADDPCATTARSGLRKIPYPSGPKGHKCDFSNLEGPTAVRYSNSGTRLAIGGWGCYIRIYDTQSGELVAGPFAGHKGYITSIDFSPDDMTVVSASADWTIRVWSLRHSTADDVNTKKNFLRGHKSAVWAVRFLPNTELVASVSPDETVRVWNTKLMSETVRFPAHNHTIRGLDVAKNVDGTIVFATVSTGGEVKVTYYLSNERLLDYSFAFLKNNMQRDLTEIANGKPKHEVQHP